MLDDGAHHDGGAGDGDYGGQIPAFPVGTTVNYYLTASDNGGLSATNPVGAPGSLFSYTVTTNSPAPFQYDVLLGRPTDHSIAVSVLSSHDLLAYVEYGSVPGVYPYQTATNSLVAGTPWGVTLDSLQPNSIYYYRLQYRASGETNFTAGLERTFFTQRAPGSAFTFIIEADPHYLDNEPPVWQRALTNMLADNPDFLIDLGDTFMGEKYYKTNSYFLSQAGIYDTCRNVRQQFFSLAGHSIPLFLVNGNHDPELGWLLDDENPTNNSAVWGDQAREFYYPCPIPAAFSAAARMPIRIWAAVCAAPTTPLNGVTRSSSCSIPIGTPVRAPRSRRIRGLGRWARTNTTGSSRRSKPARPRSSSSSP